MITIYSNEQVNVTPTMAGDWLKHNILPRYRDISPRHRDNLAKEIKSGDFILGTQIHFVRFHNEQFLVNGRHILSAIEKAGIPVTLLVLVSNSETMDEVFDIYSRHDTHPNRRRPGKVSSGHA